MLAQLGGGAPQVYEIVVRRHANHFERAGSIMPGRPLQIRYGGMGRVKRSICVLRFILLGIRINLFYMQKSQQIAVNVPQRQWFAFRDAVARRDRQRHGQGPESAIGQPHFGDHAFIIRLIHKALERRKAADGQQLEVA